MQDHVTQHGRHGEVVERLRPPRDPARPLQKDGVRVFVTGQSTTAGSLDTGVEVDMTTVAYVEPWRR